MNKPETIDEYLKWLIDEHKIDCLKNYETYYNSIMSTAKDQFLSSPFWRGLHDEWQRISSDYYSKTDYTLFSDDKLEILIKPYGSFLLKSFRMNVINNDSWPECPSKINKWLLPDNWFEEINDCLRTTIIVKYLDGVETVVNELDKLCQKNNHLFHYDYEAKEHGYYAVHSYVTMSFEVPALSWDTIRLNLKIEFQITTQIKDIIRKLTHKYYEELRKDSCIKEKKWQWDYQNEVFTVNYLGHILHYLEGMIMEIRDKRGK